VPKKAAKPKAKPKKAAPDGLSKQENAVFKDMRSTIANEAKASPAQLKKDVARVAIDQAQADNLTGLAHPDAKALLAAGVSADRVKALTAAHAPSHPAAADPNAGTGATATPSSPSQYAADVLTEAGLPDTAGNEKLLEIQMTQEGMPGGENNPLATTVQEPGSSGVNSAGVQQFPSLAEGAAAEAQTLQQSNMSPIYAALKTGKATPGDYAAALAGSAYEGYDPAANAAYANSFLADAGQPTQAFNTGGAAQPYSGAGGSVGASALGQAMGTNSFAGLNSVIPTLGTSASNNSLQSALQDVGTQTTLAANTSNAPGSPDQTPSQQQQTNVPNASTYQQAIAALLPNIRPGAVR